MNRFVIIPEILMRPGADYISRDPLGNPFIRLLTGLPPEAAAFYCERDFPEKFPQLTERLEGLKIKIRLDALEELGPGDAIIAESGFKLAKDKTFLYLKDRRVKMLFFLYSTEEGGGYYPDADEFFIYASENQLFSNMSMGRFSLDELGAPEIGLMPGGGQGAAVGLLRNDDSPDGDSPDGKEKLKTKLAEAFNFKFRPNRPLLTHFVSHNHDQKVFYRGLLKLTNVCDALVKDLNWHFEEEAGDESFKKRLKEDFKPAIKAPHFFLVDSARSANHPLNALMRYAADVNLTGCFSGTCATSIMLGLPTIPVYTKIIWPSFSHYKQNLKRSFSAEMRTAYRPMNIRIMDCLPPIDIEATESLLDAILDQDYWRRYREALPRIQRYAFGRYLLGDAAVGRARALIMRLLQFGSFLPPGYDLAKTVPGPNVLAAGPPAPMV